MEPVLTFVIAFQTEGDYEIRMEKIEGINAKEAILSSKKFIEMYSLEDLQEWFSECKTEKEVEYVARDFGLHFSMLEI